MKRRKTRSSLAVVTVLGMLLALLPLTAAPAATGDPVLINEVLASHTGTDDTEFIELFGAPGTSLDGLSLIVIEGDSGSSFGNIDRRLDFGVGDILGSNGFYLIGNPVGLAANYLTAPNVAVASNYLENSSLTVAIVQTSTIVGGSVAGGETVLDAVALTDGDAGDVFYFSAPVLGPDGSFYPAGARRLADGVDTDTVADWVFADFFLGSANTPVGVDVPPPPPPPEVTIMQIQDTGQFSPYEGDVVTTTGVVTAISANGRDMWIQDPIGDGDPATSDGIFVDDRDMLDPRPAIGDLIRVTAEVEEQQFEAALPLTRLDDPDDYEPYEIISSGNSLPASVVLDDLPNESLADGIDFWESLEGMLVSVYNAPVTAPTNRFGEFGILTKTDAKPGSGFYSQTQQIILRDLGGNEVDYNPERIMVDDVTLDDPIMVRPGDRVRSLTGVVDYAFSMWKLQPTQFDVKTHTLPKDEVVSTRSGSMGNTVITTFNVENLFDLDLNVAVVADIFGQIGFDPGSSWTPPSTKDNSLVRSPTVCEGRTVNGPFDPSVEWSGFGKDSFDDLGAHSTTCGAVGGLFISEVIEGSSFNKALEIYNGTGAAVNLGANNVTVKVYFNGNATAGQTIRLAGTLADNDVFVLANPSADSAILDVADQTSSGVLWNGDDALELSVGGKDDASSTPDADELETQLTKLALAIEVELNLPEIIVLQEIENTAVGQEMADLVNLATGTDYVVVSEETSDGRGIEVGLMYDANRVDHLESYQLFGTDVEAAFGPLSASSGREPLYGKFLIGGEIIHIVGNHFKSKGGDDPPYGVSFVRITETQRKLQAQVVRDFVNEILDGDPNALVMVTGDLNDFQFGEPGEGADHPVGILEGTVDEVPLTNLVNFEKPAEAYSFIFDGNSQVLDHMLVSPALLEVLAGQDFLHFNASYQAFYGSDATTALRASDHDPLEGRFWLNK